MSAPTAIGVMLAVWGLFLAGLGMVRSGPTAPVDGYDVLASGSFCLGVGLIIGAAFG